MHIRVYMCNEKPGQSLVSGDTHTLFEAWSFIGLELADQARMIAKGSAGLGSPLLRLQGTHHFIYLFVIFEIVSYCVALAVPELTL